MAQGRDTARLALVAVVAFLLCLLLRCHTVHAANYTVGDSAGWTFNVVDWPKGKHFKAGDVLVFIYNPLFHNVVVVNSEGYNTCRTPFGSPMYHSGNEHIELVKGKNYFICNHIGHCEALMKIAVTAT